MCEALPASAACLPEGARLYRYGAAGKLLEGEWFRAYFPQVFVPFQDRRLTVNGISTWPGDADFREAELHSDRELFLFTAGISTMFLIEFDSRQYPRADTAVRIRLNPGDLLSVDAGTPHFIGPSLTDSAACIVVASQSARTWRVRIGDAPE